MLKSENISINSKKCALIAKLLILVVIIFACFYIDSAFAQGETKSIKDMAKNIMGSFQALGELMIAVGYISGFGFTIASIFKFKQHKDNPTQIPVSTPIALLIVGIVLIFLPGIIKPAGYTIFGTGSNLEQMAGGFEGKGAESLPGGSQQ